MSKDELKARGLNDSITHVDFMVGTPDLNILGTTHDGKEIPVFVDGNFAPEDSKSERKRRDHDIRAEKD